MKATMLMRLSAIVLLAGCATSAHAVTNYFFTGSQPAAMVASNANAVTLVSGDYRFTYSADGYWSGGGGPPTGRFFTVFWPTGVQAQAITAGPKLGSGANITIKRTDGKTFDLWAFIGKILASTAGAGGAFEITPRLNGNDVPGSPFTFDATGYSGATFSHTPMLQNADTYLIHLWVDWAVIALTLHDTNAVVAYGPSKSIAANASPLGAGIVWGTGDYGSNATCTLTAEPAARWNLKNWTENGVQVSTSAAYTFVVRSNRTLVANFVPAFIVTTAASPLYGGSVSAGGTFNSNSLVTVTAAPRSGWRFVSWTENGATVSASASYGFNIACDRSLVANFAPAGVSAVFDFDTGTPHLTPGQGLPASQTKSGVTASFSTLSGSWSVQDHFYYGWSPAVFSGNFLYCGSPGSSLAIEFSQPVTNFLMTFFTGELAAEYDTAALVQVTAYTNSVLANSVADGTARGTWATGSYPEGTLAFGSATPFIKVKIEIPPQSPAPSFLLYLDNVYVQLATPTVVTISGSVSPAGAGAIAGAGSYLPGDSVTLSAVPNGSFHFANWTEDGLEASTAPDYTFTAVSNRALVANFTANQPPLAFGTTFFQLYGEPFAVNIVDLMWSDYDPDFDTISFVSVSATTRNGLALAASGSQILVPANTADDSFTYTIRDFYGATATGSASISIITNVTSRGIAISAAGPGPVVVSFAAVPWYYYQCQRATNAAFAGTLQTFPVQAWQDGSISVWDTFSDLIQLPPQAFYRLRWIP